MQEVLDEIYEKCIAETNLREFAQAHLNSDGLPNWYRNTESALIEAAKVVPTLSFKGKLHAAFVHINDDQGTGRL